MKKKILIAVGIFILVFIIIGSIGGSEEKSNNESTSTNNNDAKPTPVAEKISATDLADDFDNNQVAAEAKWKDKFVEFSAQISNITDTGISFTNVASKQFSFTQISCRITDKQQLLPLKNGQTVTVRGIVGSQTVGVISINNCETVQ